jgi:hypothetical protein
MLNRKQNSRDSNRKGSKRWKWRKRWRKGKKERRQKQQGKRHRKTRNMSRCMVLVMNSMNNTMEKLSFLLAIRNQRTLHQIILAKIIRFLSVIETGVQPSNQEPIVGKTQFQPIPQHQEVVVCQVAMVNNSKTRSSITGGWDLRHRIKYHNLMDKLPWILTKNKHLRERHNLSNP